MVAAAGESKQEIIIFDLLPREEFVTIISGTGVLCGTLREGDFCPEANHLSELENQY